MLRLIVTWITLLYLFLIEIGIIESNVIQRHFITSISQILVTEERLCMKLGYYYDIKISSLKGVKFIFCFVLSE